MNNIILDQGLSTVFEQALGDTHGKPPCACFPCPGGVPGWTRGGGLGKLPPLSIWLHSLHPFPPPCLLSGHMPHPTLPPRSLSPHPQQPGYTALHPAAWGYNDGKRLKTPVLHHKHIHKSFFIAQLGLPYTPVKSNGIVPLHEVKIS